MEEMYDMDGMMDEHGDMYGEEMMGSEGDEEGHMEQEGDYYEMEGSPGYEVSNYFITYRLN
jgi:hypothetical protein